MPRSSASCCGAIPMMVASKVDSNSKRIYKKVRHPVTGKKEEHQHRIWFVCGIDYKAFGMRMTTTRRLSRTYYFSNILCPCLRDPSKAESCVDIIDSGLQEYMTAISRAVRDNDDIPLELKDCNCPCHALARSATRWRLRQWQ